LVGWLVKTITHHLKTGVAIKSTSLWTSNLPLSMDNFEHCICIRINNSYNHLENHEKWKGYWQMHWVE